MNMRSRVGSFLRAVTLACVSWCLFVPTTGFAQVSPAKKQPDEVLNASVLSPVTQTFGGLTFGVGIALSENLQAQHRITSATVVNGVVRVTQTNDASAGIILESHYFFVPNRTLFGIPRGDWGHGPFVAIEASSGGNNVLTAFALGWMIGLRQPTWNLTTHEATYTSMASWNLGIGLRIDPSVQVLGDGITANAPLPPGESSTPVRLKTTQGYGLILVSSFSF
jgi:hypothetical protein